MQLIKNYLYNATYQIFVLLIPLVTMPYIARVLGAKNSGIVAFTTSNTQYFVLLASLGISVYGNREVAYHRQNKQALSQIFWELFSLRLVMMVLTLGVFAVFLIGREQYFKAYVAQAILIIATAFDISWFFMGLENFKVTVVRNFIVKLISLILIFVLVKSQADTVVYIFITSLSQLLGNLSMFTYLKKYLVLPKWPLHLRQHFQQALWFFIPQISVSLYTSLNKTILGWLVSVTAAGMFDYADRIVRLALAIVTAVGTVMLPRMAQMFAQGNVNKVKRYLCLLFNGISYLAVPIMFGLAAIATKFIPFFLGQHYQAVSLLMMIEAAVIVIIAWENVLGNQFLIPTDQTSVYTKAILVGAAVSLVLNPFMAKLLGQVGATVAMVAVEGSILLYELRAVRTMVSWKELFGDCWKAFFAGGIMFLVVYPLNLRLSFNIATLALEVIVGVVIYLGLLWILRPQVKAVLLNLLKQH